METAKVINEVNEVNEVNGVDLDVLFATVQAIAEDPALGKSRFRARNQWVGGSRNTTRVEGFYAGGEERRHQQTFAMEADEPPLLAGADRAPNPVEHLLHALASCVTTSIVAHAAVKGIEIDALEAELEGDIDLNGFLGLDAEAPKGYTDIRVNYRVKTSEENLRRLQQLVQFSPVYNTLVNGVNVDVGLVRA